MKKLSLVLALVAAGLSLTACSGKKANVIKIGGVAPLSGKYTQYGLECKKGIDLAVEEINAAGGIDGKTVKFICEDDEGDPAKSVNAYTKLTSQDGIRLVIGSLTSGASIAITEQAQANHVVQIAPAATAVALTDAGNYIFRACFTTPSRVRLAVNLPMPTLAQKRLPFSMM